MIAPATKYSRSQVMHGLRECWEHITGVDEPFDDGTEIYLHLAEDDAWADIDVADLFRDLESFFEFRCEKAEWEWLFGFDLADKDFELWKRKFSPKLTFGTLAEFISQRAPVVATFEPVSIFGKSCKPAGVFYGLQQVAESMTGKSVRFSPASKIVSVFRGNELERFWTKVRWMTEGATPQLPRFWSRVDSCSGCLSILLIFLGFVGAFTSSTFGPWIFAFLLAAGIVYVFGVSYKHLVNPLPKDIVTFRDLAKLIVESRHRALSSSNNPT